MTAYAGLFASAFLAATLFPAQSEAVLAALIIGNNYPLWSLLAVATLGNTLGSSVNWLIGIGIHRLHHPRLIPAQGEKLLKAKMWYHRWGRWSLLLSWAPFIGDAITLAAGILREPFWSFFAITLFAKLARYLVVAALCLEIM